MDCILIHEITNDTIEDILLKLYADFVDTELKDLLT